MGGDVGVVAMDGSIAFIVHHNDPSPPTSHLSQALDVTSAGTIHRRLSIRLTLLLFPYQLLPAVSSSTSPCSFSCKKATHVCSLSCSLLYIFYVC